MVEKTIPDEERQQLVEEARQTSYLGDEVQGTPTLGTVGTRAWRAMKKLGIEIIEKIKDREKQDQE